MEKGIDAYIKEQFGMPDVDVRTYSPLTLAYIGDGVFDLVIRSLVVAGGNTRASALHRRTSQIVKARTQAQMIERLLPELTQEEAEHYRRGRNAKSPTKKTRRCRITGKQPDLRRLSAGCMCGTNFRGWWSW